MDIGDLRDKIVEVHAAARVIVQRHGHTRKFAKHIVALVVKQYKKLTDEGLAEFLGRDPIGRLLGYTHKPNPSNFSKVRKRSDPKMFGELYNWLLQDLLKGKQIRLVAQDSTDVPAYSEKDRQAKRGVRTIPKRGRSTRRR